MSRTNFESAVDATVDYRLFRNDFLKLVTPCDITGGIDTKTQILNGLGDNMSTSIKGMPPEDISEVDIQATIHVDRVLAFRREIDDYNRSCTV